jgi:hypothetical protein
MRARAANGHRGVVAGRWGWVTARAGAGETGTVATEFVLLSSLIAAVTFGVAAVIGSGVDAPLIALSDLLKGFVGS